MSKGCAQTGKIRTKCTTNVQILTSSPQDSSLLRLGCKKNNFLQASCLIFSPRNKLLPFHSWPTAQGQTGPRPPQIQKCSLIDDPKFQQMKLGSLFTKATTGSWLKNAQPCYKRNMTLNCYIFHQRFSP